MLLKILDILQEILKVLLEIRADLKRLLPVRTDEEEVLLDNSDVKRLLKIADSTLYRWRKNNRVTSHLIGKKRYYIKSELVKLMNNS